MKSYEWSVPLSFDQNANSEGGTCAQPLKLPSSVVSDAARVKLLSLPREPFVKVRWESVLFFHFRIAPEALAPILPSMFKLELHEGTACLSLAVVPMTRFRSCRLRSRALLLQALREQKFLNLRTYVKHGAERGVLFLHGWLSRPALVPLPSKIFGLPYRFARFAARSENDVITGRITARANAGALSYRVHASADRPTAPCSTGSAEEFAMEQYSGFFARRNRGYVFRVWHPPWERASVKAQLYDTSLVTNLCPWFSEATFTGAHLTEPINDVWLSRAYRLPTLRPTPGNHRVLSGFYDLP